jgi:phosphoribosylformimino-5-aminoimidazole carboxamide ribotide isomerase
MIAWAAVDVLAGRAVRLVQGMRAEISDYGPAWEAASRWGEAGVRHLHVVDLGAAFGEPPALAGLVRRIKDRFPGAVVQAAGGVRSVDDAVALAESGADRVVVGSLLARDPESAGEVADALGPGRAVAAVDCLEGRVRVSGWTQESGLSLEAALLRARQLGFSGALVTDIARDGLPAGPNVVLCHEASGWGLPVTASGGVRTAQDLRVLAAVPGVAGVVVGRALYQGRIRPKEMVPWQA